MSLIFSSFIGYCICIFALFVHNSRTILLTICTTAAYLVYICELASYLRLQRQFAQLKREFKSPFGRAGAHYAITAFFLSLVGSVIFPPIDQWIPSTIMAIYLFLASIYYFTVATYRQRFSTEETKAMFIAYVFKGKGW